MIKFTSDKHVTSIIELIEHNSGLSKYTKRYMPWIIAHIEKFNSRSDALKREKQLKSSRGRSYIWNDIIKKEKY